MDAITIKHHIPGRARLKSPLFRDIQPSYLSQKLSELNVLEYRLNATCRSLIIYFDESRIALEQIIQALAPEQILKDKEQVVGDSCPVSSSCRVCKSPAKPVNWRRKLFTFALLAGYSIYIVIQESILGIAVAASPLSLVAIVALAASVPLLQESYEDIKAGKVTLHSFMSGTLILAILGGEAIAALEIITILRGGMLLEEYIAERSKNAIHDLIELDVKKAFVLIDGVEIEVDLENIKPGDLVVSRSGEKIPVDGVIDFGSAEIDESLINGRSEPAFRSIDEQVYAGTFIQKGRIVVRVEEIGNDTYISRIISKVERSLLQKSPSELEADKLAARLLKLGAFLTVGTFFVTASLIRAFSVMIVMSCPCATVLAASTAVSAGIARAAKAGILIKGGTYLEQAGQAKVWCFDKTGTLTTGKPVITEIFSVFGSSKEEVIYLAAIAEYRNTHPIALSILEYAKEHDIEVLQNGECETLPGLGVITTHQGERVLVGNEKLMAHHGIALDVFDNENKLLQQAAQSIVYVAKGEKLIGLIGLAHEVRPGTREMLKSLREYGVYLVMISGDETNVARTFANEYGLDEFYANRLPEQKADIIKALKEEHGSVVMVGDGVNDTLAMAYADVAISFAAGGCEAAIEASDIAITHSHPEDVVALYELSRRTLKTVQQNYWIGTGTNLGGVALAGAGLLSPVAAGAIHIGHTVGIMANSSKLAIQK